MANFLIKEEEGIKKYDSCIIIDKEKYKCISSEIKIKILELLKEKPSFISEIAKKLKINEQNVYYHIRDMKDILNVVEEKKIRGTIAKKYAPKSMNICLSLSKNFKEYKEKNEKNKNLNEFFYPFIKDGKFNSKFVVGSPDPHGPYKARARDGHYATDLALYLGNFCSLSDDFSICLDVDIKLEEVNENLIVVGGPVTNLIMGKLNENMKINFKEEKHWAIKSQKETYNDDNCGIIAKFPNPYKKEFWVLILAGVRFSGTKAAVIGLTRKNSLALMRYSGQKEFYAIIQGYDLDGDGKIDSIELLE